MAIQVNGTTVIDNSRQLTNIASVDSITAAAMGSAGVGGKTTLITDTSFSNVGSLSVDFTGGYDYYKIHLKDVLHTGGTAYRGMVARLKNSSGSISGGAEYLSWRHRMGYNAYGDDFNTWWTFANESVQGTVKQSVMIDVYNPYQSGQSTFWSGSLHMGMGNSGTDNTHFKVIGALYSSSFSTSQHNGMVFYQRHSTGTLQNFGGRVTVWGVNV